MPIGASNTFFIIGILTGFSLVLFLYFFINNFCWTNKKKLHYLVKMLNPSKKNLFAECRTWIHFCSEETHWWYGGTEIWSEELGWNQIRTRVPVSPSCPNLAPNFIFRWTFLGIQKLPKNCWPWMTFPSRSNKSWPNFQFATEYFTCWPLLLPVKSPSLLGVHHFHRFDTQLRHLPNTLHWCLQDSNIQMDIFQKEDHSFARWWLLAPQ